VAGIAIAVLLILTLFRPRRIWFILLGALAIPFAVQGAAGFLGARGFYAFGIILPAASLLLLGAIVGFQVMSGTAKAWMRGRTTGALALGCSTYLVASRTSFVILGMAGPIAVLVVTALLLVSMAIVAWRRRAVSRPPRA
jgi:hypothetical protein